MRWRGEEILFKNEKKRRKGYNGLGCCFFFFHCPSLPCLLVKISITNFIIHLMAFSLWFVGSRWMSGKAIFKLALPSALPHAYRETRTQTRLAHPQRSHMCTYEHMDRQTIKTPSGSQNQSSHTCLLLQTAHVLAFWHPHRHKDPHPDATATPTALTFSAVTFLLHALCEHRTVSN